MLQARAETTLIPIPKGALGKHAYAGLIQQYDLLAVLPCAIADVYHIGRYWEDPHIFQALPDSQGTGTWCILAI